MATIYVRDANTGDLVAIDTDNPTGTLYVIDADTGEIIPLDLELPSGIIHVNDANTGDIVEINYDNPVAVFSVCDPNTGEIVEIDLNSPSGIFYCLDANTGNFVQVDLSTAKTINSGNYTANVLSGPYYQYVKSLSPIAYWPLWEASGTICDDLMDLGNGSYTGVTLGQTGIGDGHTCPRFNGAGSVVNIYTAALNAAFNPEEGAISIYAKVFNASVWTAADYIRLLQIRADDNNHIYILRNGGVNNEIFLEYRAGGVNEYLPVNMLGTLQWFHLVATWSKSGNYVRLYVNGAKEGADASGLGNWSGVLDNWTTVIGAGDATPGGSVWNGWLAHVALWNRPLLASEISNL